MTPSAFTEDNTVLNPPPGMTPEQVNVLSVFRGENHKGVPVVVSNWKLTKEEFEEILVTKTVWLTVMGTTMPPVYLSVASPFIQVEQNEATSEETDS
jgi:hypothetical protein